MHTPQPESRSRAIAQKMRADAYVMGRLSADEREKAERELTLDEDFRAAVLVAAQRLGFAGNARPLHDGEEGEWMAVANQIAGLPHMSGVTVVHEPVVAAPAVLGETAFRRGWKMLGGTLRTARALFRRG